MRIALDALGGDDAPRAVLEGAALALRDPSTPTLVLVGPVDRLRPEFDEAVRRLAPEIAASLDGRIEFHEARDVVSMDAPPTAVRRLPDSTIVKGVGLVKDKTAAAVVTAGNTGAAVAATTLFLRTLQGVRRPGIAATLPSGRGVCTIMDVGANVKCKPIHLFQYGVMAAIYHRHVHGVDQPTVGLLNIGEEVEKGNELVRETGALFKASDVNFVGNIEGQDVFSGRCDVIVCEGFVGNVVLKVSEGLAGAVFSFLRNEVSKLLASDERAAWAHGLEKFRQWSDYAEYGGALLLGVDGICVICHGRSEGRAIANAVRLAARFMKTDVNRAIVEGLQKMEAV
jgi:glycerol-3-phosphate acyltransferase PlsX